MSKTVGYICDCCKQIKQVDEVSGISIQPDLFEPLKGFKVLDADKAGVHFCLDCYRQRVLILLPPDRAKLINPHDWQVKKDELSYAFRHSVVNQYTRDNK